MSNFIPVNTPLLIGNENKYVNECIKSGWVSSEGPFVERFESEFSLSVGRSHGVAVANGSAALDIAVAALGVSKDDEIIMPSFTIISCATAILRAGATPVLVDSDIHSWNMKTQDIESKVTSKTKAIMIVHIYGLPVDVEPILKIADKYGLAVIEDAAEMLGQTYQGEPCGSFGDISTFSFYPNKLITTGEGGMCVTDDKQLAERCKSLRNLCFQEEKRFVHEELGWNYRMSNIQAALGCAQLESIATRVLKKREIGNWYSELLKGVSGLQLPVKRNNYAESIYWVFGLLLDDSHPFNAQRMMEELNKMKIGSRPFFWPIHEQPVFKKMGLFRNEKFPIAEKLARRGFYIPSGLGLNKENVKYVAQSIREIMKKVEA